MKWFQCDTNAPGSPVMRRVWRQLGNEGIGALWRLWCWVGERGHEVGRAVDSDGRPYGVEDLLDACGLADSQFAMLIDCCLETGHIDREAWTTRQELYFPAMVKRADHYSKYQKKPAQTRKKSIQKLKKSVQKLKKTHPTIQEKTRQENTTHEITCDDSTCVHTDESDLICDKGELTSSASPATGDSPVVLAQRVRDDWNKITTLPIPRCQTLTDKRIRHVKRRLDEHGRDGLCNAFRLIEASRFCRGDNDRGWLASFDWLMASPDNVVKVLEGRYERRAPIRPGACPPPPGKYAHLS